MTRQTSSATGSHSGISVSITCAASSRVGTSTRPRGLRRGASTVPGLESRVTIGRPKARVLPEPVRPRPSTSRPAIASAIVARWIG